MKWLFALKESLVCLLVVLTGFVLCSLGGMLAITIISIFTYNENAILIAGTFGYFTTAAILLFLGFKLLKNSQKNSQEDTRE